MTSTKVSLTSARARERTATDGPLPALRDMSRTGPCLYPGCETWIREWLPTCPGCWKRVPEALAGAVQGAWKAKDQRRWLLAVEALRLYWLAVAP